MVDAVKDRAIPSVLSPSLYLDGHAFPKLRDSELSRRVYRRERAEYFSAVREEARDLNREAPFMVQECLGRIFSGLLLKGRSDVTKACISARHIYEIEMISGVKLLNQSRDGFESLDRPTLSRSELGLAFLRAARQIDPAVIYGETTKYFNDRNDARTEIKAIKFTPWTLDGVHIFAAKTLWLKLPHPDTSRPLTIKSLGHVQRESGIDENCFLMPDLNSRGVVSTERMKMVIIEAALACPGTPAYYTKFQKTEPYMEELVGAALGRGVCKHGVYEWWDQIKTLEGECGFRFSEDQIIEALGIMDNKFDLEAGNMIPKSVIEFIRSRFKRDHAGRQVPGFDRDYLENYIRVGGSCMPPV